MIYIGKCLNCDKTTTAIGYEAQASRMMHTHHIETGHGYEVLVINDKVK